MKVGTCFIVRKLEPVDLETDKKGLKDDLQSKGHLNLIVMIVYLLLIVAN